MESCKHTRKSQFGYPTKVLPHLFPGTSDDWSHLSMPQCFQRLWESINGPGSWDANRWVWVVEFRAQPHPDNKEQ